MLVEPMSDGAGALSNVNFLASFCFAKFAGNLVNDIFLSAFALEPVFASVTLFVSSRTGRFGES